MTNEEMRKRLKEAAENYAEKHGFRVPYDGSNNFYDETDVKASKDGFLTGAEFGYKEAIKKAKEWLKEHSYSSPIYPHCRIDFDIRLDGRQKMLTDFETDMNKLWEEKNETK